MMDPIYTNGVIAVKESFLLGEKLLRFTEMTAEEILRTLRENGFGNGSEKSDAESLCRAEEGALDDFIREYAPDKAVAGYLLAYRDFHNAKALCKAQKLDLQPQPLLAPQGLIPVEVIAESIKSGKTEVLGKELASAVGHVMSDHNLSGAEVGAIFGVALNNRLLRECRHSPLLRNLLADRTDRTNILTAMRAESAEYAQKLYLPGGRLSVGKLNGLFSKTDDGARALGGTPYTQFYATCIAAKESKTPFIQAERELESCEAAYFYERRYELEGKQPFLYYIFRRRAEIQNVRIIAVCVAAGMKSGEIRQRLRVI